MKTRDIIFIIVLAAIVTGSWLIFRSPSTNTVQGQNHQGLYYCPMHPWIKSDKPGVCPICGMALVLGHNHSQEGSHAF